MKFFLYFFGATSFWDGFTTVIGTIKIIGDGENQIIGAIILALGITAFLFGTTAIFYRADGLLRQFLAVSWFLAVAYDLTTSWYGNLEYVFQNNISTIPEYLILAAITGFISASPVLLSLVLWGNPRDSSKIEITQKESID
uniref:Uncharacterized protein n=1 Tax=Candidatus Kentrum sp. SD TaxID=2126332 RepID=A0A451BLU2_9GAMM|nr:MAG: hypothetical protein BECKSD772D_GA0070982_104113 [Candidatus Kentron sp. SD]